MRSNYASMTPEQLLDESMDLNRKLARIELQLCHIAGCKHGDGSALWISIRDAVRVGSGWSDLLSELERIERENDAKRDFATDGEWDRLINDELKPLGVFQRFWRWLVPCVLIVGVASSLYVLDTLAASYR